MSWLARLKKMDPSSVARHPASNADALVNLDTPSMAPAANDLAQVLVPVTERQEPDRWAWPHSQAMTGREIETMVERTSFFNRRGLPALEAELLADRLVTRDRDGDDRRLCVECLNMSGRSGAFRCAQWELAGLGQAGIPAGLAVQLQRCDGFKGQQLKRPTR